jgi:hypothetical protein
MIRFTGDKFAPLVAQYQANFESIWETRRDRVDDFIDGVAASTWDRKLVFDPMALTWSQVGEVKGAIESACPFVFTDEFSESPADYMFCPADE